MIFVRLYLLWNYDHFPFQEVIEFLLEGCSSWQVMKCDIITRNFCRCIVCHFAQITLKRRRNFAYNEKRTLKVQQTIHGNEASCFWFFFIICPKNKRICIFSSILKERKEYFIVSYVPILCSIWVFSVKETFTPKTHFAVLLHFEVRSHYNKIENQEGGKSWMWGLLS